MAKRYVLPYKMFAGIMIPHGLMQQDISSSAKLLWGVLASHCTAKGGFLVYPSNEKLAEEMCCSERNIRYTIEELIRAGLIEKIPPTGWERLKHFNNKYVFRWHDWMDDCVRDDAELKTLLRAPNGGTAERQDTASPARQQVAAPIKQTIVNMTSYKTPAYAGRVKKPSAKGANGNGHNPSNYQD